MKKFLLLFLLLPLLILSSCHFDIQPTIYIGDLVDFQASGKNHIFIPTTIKMELISADDFQEKGDKIIEMISRYFHEPSDPKVEEEDFSTYLVLKAKIPMVRDSGTLTSLPGNLLSILWQTNSRQQHELTLAVDAQLFKRLQKEFYDEYVVSLDPDDFAVQIIIDNDRWDKAVAHANSYYIEGKPHPFPAQATVKRRERIQLKMSDVLRDYLFQENAVPLAVISQDS